MGVLGHAYGPNDERGLYKSDDGGNTWTRVLDKGPTLAFLIWPSRRVLRISCLRARGTHTVRRGAPTHRCKGRAEDCIARPTAERLGYNWPAMDCPMAIGAALALRCSGRQACVCLAGGRQEVRTLSL